MGHRVFGGNAYAYAEVRRRWLHVLVVLAMIVTQLVFVPAPEAHAAVTGSTVETATQLNLQEFVDLEVDEIQSVGNDASGGTFTLSYDGVEFTDAIRWDAPLADANEVQTLYNGATGGTFTITFDTQTTGAVAYNAPATGVGSVEEALQSLTNVTDVTVTGTGILADPWVITFVDPGSQDVAEITTADGSLVGGTSTIATTQDGNLSVETALEALTDITDVTVAGTGVLADPWVITFVDPGGAVPFLLTKNDAGLVGGNTTILEHQAGESAPIDTAGITYMGGGEFLISDSEINEEDNVYDGVNIWQTTDTPTFVHTAAFEEPAASNTEPTGVAYNPAGNGHIYISNDNADNVYDVDLGADGDFGTPDDTMTTLDVGALGIGDPEDVAWDPVGNQIFVASGVGNGTFPRTITPIGLGADGKLGTGDDIVGATYDVSSMIADLEGAGYRAASDTLLLVAPGPSPETIFETTKDGRLIREIRIGATVSPSDVTIAPASGAGSGTGDSLYIVDRGKDNSFSTPAPRDGKWWEYQTAFANLEPLVDAGLDQVIVEGDPANLVGDSYDDGQGSDYTTPPFIPTTTWSKKSGPGTVTFGDANALSTTATFTLPGVYELELTSSDGDFSPSDTVVVTVKTVERLWGTNRFGTAAAVADAVFPSPSVAYIAVGANFPDALVAGSVGDGPVLLTTTNTLPDETKAALEARKPLDEIFIVGGTAVVSPAVETALGAYTSTVTRLAGPSRYDTAAAFSADRFPSASTVFVAFGGNFPDALVASAAAGSLGAPVLLVETNSIPTATADELARLNPSTIYVIGGTAVISDTVRNALDATYGTVTRVAGPNRFATAAEVSSTFFPSATDVWIATGLNFPDALVAAGGAINNSGPVLLVLTNAIPAETGTELARTSRTAITIVGGTAVVSSGVQTALAAYLD